MKKDEQFLDYNPTKIEIIPGVFGKFENSLMGNMEEYGYLHCEDFLRGKKLYLCDGSRNLYHKFTPGLPPLHREEK